MPITGIVWGAGVIALLIIALSIRFYYWWNWNEAPAWEKEAGTFGDEYIVPGLLLIMGIILATINLNSSSALSFICL